MEKSKPMELGLGELLSNQNIVNNNSFRFINRDLGIVISFAQMDSILFSTGRPYRTRESRIIRDDTGGISKETPHLSGANATPERDKLHTSRSSKCGIGTHEVWHCGC